jgi:hypothetical protein
MNIYFNGCSFTYGDELLDPAKSAWPVLVANDLQSDFFNDAVSGGTNQRTVYKTVCNEENFDYFVIAWTFYSRFTEYNPVDNFEINFNPSLNQDPSLHYSIDLKKNYAKYETFGKLYYADWYNELYQFKQWLQQIILLQSFFKTKQKKYVMLNTSGHKLNLWLQPKDKFIDSTRPLMPFFDYLSDDLLLAEHKSIQQLVENIDKENFIEWNKWAIVDYTSDYKIGTGGHLLEDGHAAVAKKVINYIK